MAHVGGFLLGSLGKAQDHSDQPWCIVERSWSRPFMYRGGSLRSSGEKYFYKGMSRLGQGRDLRTDLLGPITSAWLRGTLGSFAAVKLRPVHS